MSDYLVEHMQSTPRKRSAQLKNCMILGVQLQQPLDGVW